MLTSKRLWRADTRSCATIATSVTHYAALASQVCCAPSRVTRNRALRCIFDATISFSAVCACARSPSGSYECYRFCEVCHDAMCEH